MKTYKILNTKSIILDKYQLQKYLEKLASDHVLKEKSDKNTYPIPRLIDNFEIITLVYNLLNEHIKLKIPIHPAGEWILDNYYIIDETVKNIEKELNLKKYTNFLGISNGNNYGFARVYVIASEIVTYTDAKIDGELLTDLLKSYQEKKKLNMEEIWNIGIFLQIALIENIRNICEKIYSVELQKYRVENIIERLIENKTKDELKFNKLNEYKTKVKEYGEMKYPFIEYMSYKLKKFGKKAYPFLNILEEQVNKIGTEVNEVIKKEHFDIAVKKVSMGNSITSIKNIQRINFINIFEEINQVDEILKKDPANVYDKMDYKTKIYYRNKIKELSKKTKTSEIYIAKKCLELSQNQKGKKSHIGYYLIDNGYNKLLEILQNKKIRTIDNNKKMSIYIYAKTIICILISSILATYIYYQTNKIWTFVITILLTYIPIQIIFMQLIQYISNKIVKPKLIPKLDLQNGIPKEAATFVVIPTIITKKEKIKEIMKKLEVYYIANKSENIYFALLGDVSSGSKQNEDFDEEICSFGLEEVKKLNEKYKSDEFPKFHFIYRKRIWNEKEECYLGWERKRGLLNQFNEYILKNSKSDFKVNTIDLNKIPKIKYVITLDADTELVLNTGLELIGAMEHILNKPEVKNGIVENGHGIIQPRVGISLLSASKTKFTKLYSGLPGIDSYTNAISDIYQDNFKEGIYTGKGIYNLEVFSEVLKNEIPDNTVLSHDLLEGSYLKCGLATDIMLMDGYPTSYMAYKIRQSRWIRGDWQILTWLFSKIKNKDGIKKDNPLNIISKYKILNNLVKSTFEIFVILTIIFLILLGYFFKINVWPVMIITILSAIMPSAIEIINRVIYKKDGEGFQRTFYKSISGIKASILRAIIEIGLLPDKAYTMCYSITKTLYRMYHSKKHLLEWTTAEEAEKNSKTDVLSYNKDMWINIFLGIFIILFAIVTNYKSIFLILLGVLWIVTPTLMSYISKKEDEKFALDNLNNSQKEYLLQIGKKTWEFFKENITEKSNFLPPDNYQEDRKEQIVYRTSPTNIGLGLLAVVSSYDLKYENIEDTINLLYKMTDTIYKMQKWNGHLYNWYNIKTLEPLSPKYVSTVDSGNFIGYLYTLKQFLEEINNKEHKKLNDKVKMQDSKNNNTNNVTETINKINTMLEIIDNIIKNTDFKYLYSKENRIFSIGFNVEDNSLTHSYYDLLASEARQASLIAIAKKDVSPKHWYSLSRTLTTLNRYKGLISWSGTMFEYLMPNINIPKYPGSIISESSEFAIMCGKEYAKELNLPWGVSEAAFNLRDLNNNYQYKAFGVPWLGLKRGLIDEMVVSSYGTMLALNDHPIDTLNNLKRLEEEGMYNKYGFYESIDYTFGRLKKGEKSAVIKTYMAHHQGLILLSINNLFNKNILQKRFMENPEIEAVEILLEERMPENVIITKEKKERIEETKNIDYETYLVREYNKPYEKLKNINTISSENYLIVMDQKGNGYSKYKDIVINRFKKTDDVEQGIFFFFKNIKTKRIWTSGQMNYLSLPDKYLVQFTPEMNKIIRQDGGIETTTKTFIVPNSSVEIRRIELKNLGNIEETIEVSSFIEPILSSLEQDYSHKAFNNLFLSFEFLEDTNTVLVKRNQRDNKKEDIYLAVNLYTKNKTIGDLEYEFDKEKFLGRQNVELPVAIKNSNPFSNKTKMTLDPVIALRRTINILPSEKVIFNLVMAISNNREEAINLINENLNEEKIIQNMNLTKVKAEAETMYLGIKSKDIETYQKMLKYLIYQNPLKLLMYKQKIPKYAPTSELWKYGISGDLPILMVKIKDINDIEVVKEAIQAYEYFKVKNIKIDLVILNEEKKNYENYLQEEIQNSILDKNLGYMQNINGGIFIIQNNIDEDSKNIIEYRANLLIDAQLGGISRQLKDFEDEYIEKTKDIQLYNSNKTIVEQEKERKSLNSDELKYYNEYGGFSNDGSEYLIRVNKDEKLPTVWSNIMANENFGTVVTEGMGGYTWFKNCRLNRLTAWNNSQVEDVPSEIMYLKDLETQKIWSLAINPAPDDNDYYITYGFGYSKYIHTSNGIYQELKVFVPNKDSAKVQILHLENKLAKKKQIKLIYCVKPVLDEDEIKSNGYINLEYNKNINLLTMQNQTKEESNSTIMYISSSEEICSYTGSKTSFIGNGTIKNPDGINCLELNKENSLGKDGIAVIEIKIDLEAFETKDIVITLGADTNLLNIQDTAYKYMNINNAMNEYNLTKKYWEKLLDNIKVETPLESINIMLNGWLLYQTLCSRMFARSGYYQSGGAYGFRDQLQDCISLKYISPDILKKQIIKHSEHQFIEGDVEHWWHEDISRGIRTKFSDDLLWLPYMVAEYINFTKDVSILNIETNYIQAPILEDNVDEKYDLHLPSSIKESIYMHCIRAIEKSLNFGENGLPKIGSGDWNDGFSNVGNKGKGESVWLGFFLYTVLDKFSKICEIYGENLEKNSEKYANNHNKENLQDDININNNGKIRVEKYRSIMEKLKKALNTNGWDGRWYKRAFMDDGNVLGSIQNEECRIDSIAQSWATISKAGDNDKKYISIEALENHLVDKEAGIIKLLDPPFEKSKLEPGYIKAYIPGTRENGGQYTHAAIWAIIAEALLGFGDKATEYFKMINPIEHSRTKEEAKKYKVEPYVVAADIYGGSLLGRGGWTWYTGSSSWMYEAGIKYILGLNIQGNILKIEPSIPENWKEYSIRYKYGNSIYNIKVINKNRKSRNKTNIRINNNIIDKDEIILKDDGNIYNVEVEI